MVRRDTVDSLGQRHKLRKILSAIFLILPLLALLTIPLSRTVLAQESQDESSEEQNMSDQDQSVADENSQDQSSDETVEPNQEQEDQAGEDVSNEDQGADESLEPDQEQEGPAAANDESETTLSPQPDAEESDANAEKQAETADTDTVTANDQPIPAASPEPAQPQAPPLLSAPNIMAPNDGGCRPPLPCAAQSGSAVDVPPAQADPEIDVLKLLQSITGNAGKYGKT